MCIETNPKVIKNTENMEILEKQWKIQGILIEI